MRVSEFNHLDGTFLNLDRRPDTWSVHLEVRVTGRISGRRLNQALLDAIRTHPLAQARLQYFEGKARRYYWEIPPGLDHTPLTVIDATTDDEVVALRNRLVSVQVPLTLAPCFLVYLVHHPQGDYLMLNVPHTLADGMSAFRLLQSIIRHYAGLPDPVPDFDPLSVRDLRSLVGSRSLPQLIERTRLFLEHMGRSVKAPVRIASQGVTDQDGARNPGYGVEFLGLTPTETKAFMKRREKPATVNDMLLAAMALTIRRWNLERTITPGRIALMMPVNMRPEGWWHEVVTNYSSYVSISLPAEEQTTFNETSAHVCRQTTAFKEAGAAGILIDLLSIPHSFPAFLKARLNELFPLFGKTLMETTWVSNLGRLSGLPDMGDAGRVSDVYFTPPAPMPCSLSAGIACVDDRLLIGLRYRVSQFDAAAAREFAGMLKTVLLEGA